MKGVRILAVTRRFLSSNVQTGCGVHPPFSSVATGCSFSASCCHISLTLFFLYFADRASQYIYLNINQLDALNFIMILFHASTCFEHKCLSSGGQNCIVHSLVSSHWQCDDTSYRIKRNSNILQHTVAFPLKVCNILSIRTFLRNM